MELAPILPSGKMVGHSPMTYSGERLKQNNVLSVMLCFHSVRESLPKWQGFLHFCIFAFLHSIKTTLLVKRVPFKNKSRTKKNGLWTVVPQSVLYNQPC